MTHETLKFTTGGLWRELPDNENTEKYLMKLSHASTVYVLFDSGEAWELECGKIVKSGLFASGVIPQKALTELERARRFGARWRRPDEPLNNQHVQVI